jgi:pyruvate dehydrogenase E1 component alpha subunit
MTTTTIEQSAAELAGHQGFSIISNEKLRQLYIFMVKCRLLQERLRARNGLVKLDAAAGREAAAAGVVAGLLPEDTIAASSGDPAVRFLQNEIQGKPLGQLLTPASKTEAADQLLLALNAAQSSKTAGNGGIAVLFSGDHGFSQEMLKKAKVKMLPVIFVYQTSVLSETNPARAGRIPVMPVDGTDVVAVYRVATESITHARKGNGPTLIECFFDPSEADDPIQKMEAYLTRKGLFGEEWKLEAVARFTRELDAAIEMGKA